MTKTIKPLMPSEQLTPEFVREAIRQLKEVALKPDENGFYYFPIPRPTNECRKSYKVNVAVEMSQWELDGDDPDEDDENDL